MKPANSPFSLKFLSMFAVLMPLAVQAAGPAVPDAGSILQQIQPVKPATPSSGATGLKVEQEGVATLPGSAPFLVQSIQISGNTVFDSATLHALVADAEQKNLTLSQLGELAARITAYYRTHDYPLARAIIPAQTIKDGVVRIAVIEARYDKIKLDNRSRVGDPLLAATLAPLQSGQFISQNGMDHSLLLLSDIPGVLLSATLKPGQAVGTSDLEINAMPTPAVSGNVALDNDGNRYTGRARLGGTVNYNNPFHHGDVLSASVLSSGDNMKYGRLGYESLLNGQGTTAGGSYSFMDYALGEPLTSLRAHGTAQVASLWAKHPFVRTRDINLYGQLQYDWMQLHDHVDASALRTDRHLDNWTLSLSGDLRDALLSGGVNTWNLAWTKGRVSFDDAAARAANATTAKTEGDFSKLTANLARTQRLGQKNSLAVTAYSQWANGNLDSSQKMSAGGPNSVRAYDSGVVSGDSGYQGTAEYRYELGQALQGQWQAVAFIDSAHVTVNKSIWAAGINSATLSGAGLGLNWYGADRWSAKATIAAPIGSTPALVGSTYAARAWLEISKRF